MFVISCIKVVDELMESRERIPKGTAPLIAFKQHCCVHTFKGIKLQLLHKLHYRKSDRGGKSFIRSIHVISSPSFLVAIPTQKDGQFLECLGLCLEEGMNGCSLVHFLGGKSIAIST